jgi:hypothetical protein
MRPLRLSFHTAIVCLLAPLQTSPDTIAGARTAQAAASFSSKIDPTVIAATANGGVTPFLIILAEQADLSAAARLVNKNEKGEYVLDALRSTADRTQSALQTALDRQGIAYRGYYIVNSIAVLLGALEFADEKRQSTPCGRCH